jgi:DNA processing protein
MDSLKSDIKYWLAATRLSGVGPLTFRRWLERFGSIETLFSMRDTELNLSGLTMAQQHALKNPDWRAVEKDITWCEKNKCRLITLTDDCYPALLREITDPPLVLFVQGDVQQLLKPQLAIVGSRHATKTGENIAEQFALNLARAGLVITSGLALGIDAASHQGALKSGGQTIAVLGSGLKTIYPKSHLKLAEKIVEKGALVSEFSPDELPKASHFPRRNRIISGLSLGVLVVEAAQKSGSLITARYAIEQGRDVFAVPGSIHNPLVRGCHLLLRQGAKLVETAQDVIEELGALYAVLKVKNDAKRHPECSEGSPDIIERFSVAKSIPQDDKYLKLDEKSQQLMKQIGYEVTPLDVIIIQSGLTTGEVSSMLLSLELQGHIQTVSGGYMRVTK